MKTCVHCHESKPFDQFSKKKATADGLDYRCKACRAAERRAYYLDNREAHIERAKQWKKDNPERWREIARDYARRKRWGIYGITEEDFVRLMEACDGKCEVCSVELDESVGVAVDHDHSTGAVRGMLCGPCNRGIGLLKDDPARLDAAAAYLRRHGKS